MTFPAFKAGDAFLRGTGGGFDFHTPPPLFTSFLDDSNKIVPFLYNSFTSVWHSGQHDLTHPDNSMHQLQPRGG